MSSSSGGEVVVVMIVVLLVVGGLAGLAACVYGVFKPFDKSSSMPKMTQRIAPAAPEEVVNPDIPLLALE